MKAILKKEYSLDGLCCAMCADKMQTEISKLDGVLEAVIDFSLQRLYLRISDSSRLTEIIAQTDKIIHHHEPDIVISEFAAKPKPKSNRKEQIYKAAMIIGTLIFIVGMVFNFTKPVEFMLFFTSYLLIGGEVVWRAIKNIIKGQIFDENFLMSVATIGAFAIGEYPEGVAVMLFYQVGEMFQDMAVNRSRKSISALMDIRPDFANLKIGDEIKRVSPEEVHKGNLIIVKPGEKIPLDGVIANGFSTIDTSALTGESLPRDVGVGALVLSGSINKNGLLTIEVTKEFGESTVSKILDLVQNASSKKAPVENFITKFARYYTPTVVFAALALAVIPPLVIAEASFADWINRALVFLVVSCPCALVISIPLSFFGGIGGASRNGILVKGSNFLEALNSVDTVVFDKTGTLTKGTFKVAEINPANGYNSKTLLKTAAYAESSSNHPIALSILQTFGEEIDFREIMNYEEVAGHGIRVNISGKQVLVGNDKLLESEGIDCDLTETLGTTVYVSVDGLFVGSIVIADEVKTDSRQAIIRLKEIGIKRIVMLTGDTKQAGEKIGKEIGLDEVYSELLPHEKVERLEHLEQSKSTNGKLVFVGDGINDAPVLARSDIGIAMGGVGSDAAIEAADVVLMTDEPTKIVTAIQIAKKTHKIVWQNIVFALGVKVAILILGALGIATMWIAVFGDVGVAVIAILNAMRAMNTEKVV